MKFTALMFVALTMTAAAATTYAAETKPKTTAVHSPESIECTKEADAKGLHGAERKKFRADCKKGLKAKASTTPSGAPPPATKPKTATQPSTK